MSLLLPLGLVALVALPIVVLLHMRHTTPLPRPVPTLRFWLAAQPERIEQTRFRRPPLSLLLLLHLLIAGLLAAALARPVGGDAWDGLGLGGLGVLRTEPRHLILLLDGSTSMAATDTADGRSRFETARAEVLEQLDDLREGDVATVLLLGTRTTTLGATDAGSLGLLRQRMEAIAPPGGRANLDEALALTRDLLLPNLDDQVLVITDGAVAADPATVADLGAPIELQLVGGAARDEATGNVAIVDLTARANTDAPDLLQLYARIRNFSSVEVTAPVSLVGDGGIEIGRQTVTLPADGGQAELSWPLPPDTAEATVQIDMDDALRADNVAALVLQQGNEEDLSLQILLSSEAPSDLQRVLRALPGARLTIEPSDNLAATLDRERFDLIVFEQSSPPPEIAAELDVPLVFINPPADSFFTTTDTMVAPTVTRLRAQDPLLAGVDLAGVTFGETPVYELDSAATEVVGAAEGPLIFRTRVDEQAAIVLAFNLTGSNLPRRVAFPILIANAVTELAPSPLPPAVPLGDPLRYRPRAGAAAIRVEPPDGDPVELAITVDPAAVETETAPDEETSEATGPERLREVAFADTGQPGVYTVTELALTGEELSSGRFNVNAGHPRESDLRPSPGLAATLATATGGGGDNSEGSSLLDFWPLLTAAALLLLALEWLVALLPRRRALRVRAAAPAAAAGRR